MAISETVTTTGTTTTSRYRSTTNFFELEDDSEITRVDGHGQTVGDKVTEIDCGDVKYAGIDYERPDLSVHSHADHASSLDRVVANNDTRCLATDDFIIERR